jgi:predicted secreted protein
LALVFPLLFPFPISAAEDPATTTLVEEDSRRTVLAKVGDTISIRLVAQLGTGYGWQLAALENQVLTQVGGPKSKFITVARSTSNIRQNPGGSEFQVFLFEARAPGNAELKFKYSRGFEPDNKPLRTVVFRITVVGSNV